MSAASPDKLDVARRSDGCQTGDARRHDGRGRGVGSDDEMPRRAQHRKGGHRKQHGVQAGHHRHAGNGRIAENRRDPERSKGKTGQYVGGHQGAIYRTDPGEDRHLAGSGTCGPSAAGQPLTHSHKIRWEVTTLHDDSRSGTCVILAPVSGRRAPQ
jgi:hypothetical protein